MSLSDSLFYVMPVGTGGWDDWFASPHEAEAACDQAGKAGEYVLAVGFAMADVRGLLADMAGGGWNVAAGSPPERLARREEFPHAGNQR